MFVSYEFGVTSQVHSLEVGQAGWGVIGNPDQFLWAWWAVENDDDFLHGAL